MKHLKLFGLLSGLLFSALVMSSCGDDEEDPLGGARKPSDIQWAQHSYQIHCSGESWTEIKWEGYYASIYDKWTFNKGSKKDHRIFFSHYRWFPADYGPTYWTEKLDNGDVILSTPNGEATVTLKRLTVEPYDGSYDETLKDIL